MHTYCKCPVGVMYACSHYVGELNSRLDRLRQLFISNLPMTSINTDMGNTEYIYFETQTGETWGKEAAEHESHVHVTRFNNLN